MPDESLRALVALPPVPPPQTEDAIRELYRVVSLLGDSTMLTATADHGALSGLGDDDHPQYAQIAADETINADWVWTIGKTLRFPPLSALVFGQLTSAGWTQTAIVDGSLQIGSGPTTATQYVRLEDANLQVKGATSGDTPGITIGEGDSEDMALTFDDGTNRTFMWDDSPGRFDLNNTLNLSAGNLLTAAGGGLGIGGVAPTSTLLSRFDLPYTASGVTGIDAVARLTSGAGGGNNYGIDFEQRYESTTNSTGEFTAARFRTLVNANAIISGALTGGIFEAGYTSSATPTTGAGGTIYCGQFLISDDSAATRNIVGAHGVHVGYSQTNKTMRFNTGVVAGVYVEDMTDGFDPNGADDFYYTLYAEPQDNATDQGPLNGNIYMAGTGYDTGHIQLGAAHIWYDPTSSNECMRIYNTKPSADTDGIGLTGGVVSAGSNAATFLNAPFSTATKNPDAWLEVYNGSTKGVVPWFDLS